MTWRVAALGLGVAAITAAAGCGGSDSSSGTTTASVGGGPPAPLPTAGQSSPAGGQSSPAGGPSSAASSQSGGGSGSGLPFTYQSTGQGGSPSFTIPSAGNYAVAWQASGVTGQPACTVSLGLSADTSSYPVVDGVQVGPGDKKSGSTTLHLAAGSYRAVEGGGCGWSLTVRAA
ncbi:MAG TPA: hypothetical protein VFO60_07900 [Candidatus Dormibacteraeota bacterium]|nr:hypothetical protein [Candidatus Dormibacteraeota bacterium]